MSYQISKKEHGLVLNINMPEPNEGDEILTAFKGVLSGYLNLGSIQTSFLIELVKNILDHADKGYMIVFLNSRGVSFRSKSIGLCGTSNQDRSLRSRRQNCSIGMNTIASWTLYPEYAIVKGFEAYCFLSKQSERKTHVYSGDFIE